MTPLIFPCHWYVLCHLTHLSLWVKTCVGHFKWQRYNLSTEECSNRLLKNCKQFRLLVNVSDGLLRLTLRPTLNNLGICLSCISLMGLNITCITNDGCWQFHINCHRKNILISFDWEHWPERERWGRREEREMERERKREGVQISVKYFSWKFLCKQVLNWCLRIVERNVSLAIVLELWKVWENDEVTYSTKIISRPKKENRTFILSHTFLGLQQRNRSSAASKNN